MVAAAATGLTLGAVAGFADCVPLLLNEVGEARADRSGWSQASEFVSLILDSGWAWAATGVLAGWLAGRERRALRGAVAGFLALAVAVVAFYGVETLFADGWGSSGQVRFWLVPALVFGLPLGALGAVARDGGIAGALAAVVVPAGAVLNTVVLPLPGESRMAVPALVTIWTGAVAATALIVARATHDLRRPRAETKAGAGQA